MKTALDMAIEIACTKDLSAVYQNFKCNLT